MGRGSGYLWELRIVSESQDLIVCLSAADKLQRWIPTTRWNVLFLADAKTTFYTLNADRIAKGILTFANRRSFRKIIFIGGSKAGFGSLLLSALVSQQAPQRNIICLSFCPQTQIFPHNERIAHFGSYQLFRALAAGDRRVEEQSQRHGDVRICENIENCSITIVYNEGNKIDAAEVNRLNGRNIRKIPLPFHFHNATIPFVFKTTPVARLARAVDVIYTAALKDSDLAAALPLDKADMIEAIRNCDWIPSIEQFIDAALEGRLDHIGPTEGQEGPRSRA